MNITWVVVADNERARFFSDKLGKKTLTEIDDLVHPEARIHERDLISDKPGRVYDSVGGGRHSMEQKTDVKKHYAQVFAEQIGEKLEQARNDHDFQHLVLIAPPEFLGILRKQLSDQCAKLVIQSFDKDLTLADITTIKEVVF